MIRSWEPVWWGLLIKTGGKPNLSDSLSVPQFLASHAAGSLPLRAKQAFGLLKRQDVGTHGAKFVNRAQALAFAANSRSSLNLPNDPASPATNGLLGFFSRCNNLREICLSFLNFWNLYLLINFVQMNGGLPVLAESNPPPHLAQMPNQSGLKPWHQFHRGPVQSQEWALQNRTFPRFHFQWLAAVRNNWRVPVQFSYFFVNGF